MGEDLNSSINIFEKLLHDNILDEEDTCLITNEKLEYNNIELSCGHQFNYIPLYNEVKYQKTKKMLDNSQLKINEIKCPYCRTITRKILPFYAYYSIKSIRGVTYPTEHCIKIFECEHSKNGIKCTNTACKTETGIFCNKHLKYKQYEEEIIKTIDCDFNKLYKKKIIKELKEELRKYKLKISGNKEEMINRIYIHIKMETLDA